jgi:hypothetical protein
LALSFALLRRLDANLAARKTPSQTAFASVSQFAQAFVENNSTTFFVHFCSMAFPVL